jgi:hypothetical protein
MLNPSSALDWIGATAKSPSVANPKSKNLLILRPFLILDEIGTASASPLGLNQDSPDAFKKPM